MIIARPTSCVNATNVYVPEGCGDAWNAYVACAAMATVDCTKGPMGCDTESSGYLSCQMRSLTATSCNRDLGDDATYHALSEVLSAGERVLYYLDDTRDDRAALRILVGFLQATGRRDGSRC